MHKLGNVAAEAGDFSNEGRGDERAVFRSRQKNVLDARV